MSIFVNRNINMNHIKTIGFDMDHTIIRYKTKAFETLTHQKAIEVLISKCNYPKCLKNLAFEEKRAIQGLIIDTICGNLLKISRYGEVKKAYHGEARLDTYSMQKIYRNRVVHLYEERFYSLDTSFSISQGVLYGQLIELKKQGILTHSFSQIHRDLTYAIDLVHINGDLKTIVKNNIQNFIHQDPELASHLEYYKSFGKNLIIITNSDYPYCKLLMDYAIQPFLKKYNCWSELFDITITFARKPHFFTTSSPLLKINPKDGTMSNHFGPIGPGIYQGGSAGRLQQSLGHADHEILYLGDHIYGDVVSLKKNFHWRTALVLEPLWEEVQTFKRCQPILNTVEKIRKEKEALMAKIHGKKSRPISQNEMQSIQKKIQQIDQENGLLSLQYKQHFNPYWGELMRAGQEESRFADQVEKYACLYMARALDLMKSSPKNNFYPKRRILPHEIYTETYSPEK